MEANAWNWKKKSMEKTILPANKVITPSRRLEELYALMKNDVAPEIPEKNLSEKLSSFVLDSNVKQEESTKHARTPQETIPVRVKVETESGIQKKELDEASRKEAAPNKRMSNMDASINDHVLEKLRTYEKSQEKLEDMLKESSRQVGNLAIENSNLSEALLVKDKMIDDLQKLKTQVDAELNVLISRLDSSEKENSFVKYEFRMLEKELEVRNEELEYNRLFVDKSLKQRLENEKKMTILEAECQRLRLLMQKRLPSSASMSNMKTEVDLLGRGQSETRRNKKNPSRDLIARDKNAEHFVQISSKQIDIIVEQLQRIEEENKSLKEVITNKTSELHSSRIMHSKTASRLSQMEKRLGELSNDKKEIDLAICSSMSKDELSSSRDKAPVSVSRNLSNFPEAKALDFSDMSLMDDFVEMERLALVSVETPRRRGDDHDDKTGKELVLVESVDSSSCDIKREIHSKELEIGKPFDWLQVVLNAMSEQKRISNRSMEDIFRDVKIALGYVTHLDFQDVEKTSDSSTEASGFAIKVQSKSNIHKSVSKIIELVEGICSSSYNHRDNLAERKQTSFIHVLCGNISELNATLTGFIRVCDDLLNGKADFEKFAEALRFTLDWILANYESWGDSSSPRFKINGHLGLKRTSIFDGLNAEAIFESAMDKVKLSTMQLQESKKTIGNLQAEVDALKKSKGIAEEQIQNQKLINEDLDTQLSVARAKLNEAFLKFSSLEVELEDKSNCCEELEAACLELQLQLESMVKKESPQNSINEEGKHSPNGWEITAASSKLAECQEAILNLGKELKALSLPKEAASSEKAFSMNATYRKNLIKRSSLRDQMLAEDDAKMVILKAKEAKTSAETKIPSVLANSSSALSLLSDMKYDEADLGSRKKGRAAGTVAVVSSRRPGGFSLLQKLLLRRKKSGGKKSWSVPKT